MHIDLGRGQANALAGIHGLDQVIGKLPHRTIHMGYEAGLGAQAWVGILKNY
jgi:hypothetical protein